MNFSICVIVLVWQFYKLPQISATEEHNDDNDDICPFEDTVDLTNQPSYLNGSFLYEGILIPLAKQRYYDYQLRFLGARETVPLHLRGCVCGERPCLKLCCERHQFFNGTNGMCEEITPDMNVSWHLEIQLENGNSKHANVFQHFTTQIGLPCSEPEALEWNLDAWIMKENGILFVESDNSNLNTLDYCYSPRFNDDTKEYALVPFSCPIINDASWKLLLNTYAMAVSVLFLIPTILVYLILKELRGNLRGKLLICYLISLSMGYGIISFINISGIRFDYVTCSLLGYTCYFFFMAAFLWLSVLCFDIWKNFKEKNIELNSRRHLKHFILYSLYAWLSAGVATVTIVLIQLSTRIDDIYKPGIGVEMCWLDTDRWVAAVYFYGPNMVILLFNFVTFAHLTTKIYKVRRDLARMTHKEKFFQENAVVILRLFLIMGISWLFDIISYCLRNYEEWDFFFILSDFANAIQGLLIFSLFVLKPNVLNLLKMRFSKTRTEKIGRRSVSSLTTNFTKLQSSTCTP